jgi:hypothetical protein
VHTCAEPCARPKRKIFYVLVDWAFCFEFRDFAYEGHALQLPASDFIRLPHSIFQARARVCCSALGRAMRLTLLKVLLV